VNEHEKTAKAAQQVEAITGLYIHLVVFALVMVLLLVVNWVTLEDGIWWVQWPFLGWGLGVALHAWAVYGTTPNFIAKWQLRKIKELKDKM
jgi:two-component system LytT family sensor kinase